LWTAIQLIEAKGAHVIEVESGRSTADRADRDAMIADAIEALTHSGRSPRRRDGAGRPAMDVEDTKEAARVAWFSREHRTNADAIRAGPAKWKEWRYYRNFGPSGRDN
jgi:ketopantoate hydroxymethyltransferase